MGVTVNHWLGGFEPHIRSQNLNERENNMTCRGYDAKAVKVPKSIKRYAAYDIDAHRRGATIKSFVKILESELRTPGGKK
jgi:hypothetical protein